MMADIWFNKVYADVFNCCSTLTSALIYSWGNLLLWPAFRESLFNISSISILHGCHIKLSGARISLTQDYYFLLVFFLITVISHSLCGNPMLVRKPSTWKGIFCFLLRILMYFWEVCNNIKFIYLYITYASIIMNW